MRANQEFSIVGPTHHYSAFEFVAKIGGLLHAEQLIAKRKSIKERL